MSRYDAVEEDYKQIDFAARSIQAFLEKKSAGQAITLDEDLTASVFAHFFDEKVKQSMQYAEEIDQEYSAGSDS